MFQNSPLHYEWQAQDCMTMDQLPYIDKLNKAYPKVYVITGFHKWGMAKALIGAKIIADLMENKLNEFYSVTKIKRGAIRKSPIKFLTHTASSTLHLLQSFFTVPLKSYKQLKPNEGGIFLVKGKKRGVYKDDAGKFHFVKARCSHLKCQLKFDPNNNTFICPCHGSMYTVEGEVLLEPAIKPISVKNDEGAGALKQ
jgi:nitrite reductase/ring-hydroxylating ferredoxin subunit